MRTWTNAVFGLAVLLTTGVASWAQDEDKPRAAQTEARSEADRLTEIKRAGEVIGVTVKNQTDENLGKIDDLVFTQDGKCHYAIVGDGGTLGIGENYVAVPLKAIKCDEANKVARVEMSKSKFTTAPMFKKAAYYERWTPEWCESVHAFFGTEPSKAKKTSDDAPPPTVFYASQFMKANVENGESKKIAQAMDIICNKDCQAQYAILSHGGVLKIGDKEIAVPWQAFTVRRGDNNSMVVVLNMTEKQLESAPVISRTNYADLTDEKFVDSIHRYFGVSGRKEVETEAGRKPDKP